MKLVVGLGNPGERYRETRHNVGFRVVDQVALVNQAGPWRKNHDGLLTDCWIDGVKTLLFMPQTFMNNSGLAVRKIVDFHKIGLEDLLIVADDFSLPLGKLRLRPRGSAGGQNGLKDIFRHLGTDEIGRLRVGIGSPGADPVNFVLTTFSASERPVIDDAVIDAGRAVECWCKKGMEATMNQFNGKETGKE